MPHSQAGLEEKIIEKLRTYPAVSRSTFNSFMLVPKVEALDKPLQALLQKGIVKRVVVPSGKSAVQLFYLAEASEYIEGFMKHFHSPAGLVPREV